MSKNVIIGALTIAVVGLAYLLWSPTYTTPAQTLPETVAKEAGNTMCAQVITAAKDPVTGKITEFPTPCDVPKGWELIENDVPGLDLQVQ